MIITCCSENSQLVKLNSNDSLDCTNHGAFNPGVISDQNMHYISHELLPQPAVAFYPTQLLKTFGVGFSKKFCAIIQSHKGWCLVVTLACPARLIPQAL